MPQYNSHINTRFCATCMNNSMLAHLIISGCFCGVFVLQLCQVCLFVLCPDRFLQVGWQKNKNYRMTMQGNTTQHTKHKTHNNQHELPPPYPPAVLLSASMGRSRALTTHGAASSYGPMLSANGRVLQHGGWFPCFRSNDQAQQNREMDGAKAFNGRCLIERSNNQLSVSVMGGRFPKGGAAGVECLSWRCPIVWVDDEKKKWKNIPLWP